MGKRKAVQTPKDWGWDEVEILKAAADARSKPPVKSLSCDHQLVGGVDRIKGHLLGDNINIKACQACPEVPQKVHDKLLSKKVSKEAKAARKRTRDEVDAATCNSPQPLKKQALSGQRSADAFQLSTV